MFAFIADLIFAANPLRWHRLKLALGFTLLYIFAVAADHWSTLHTTGNGRVETNFLFRAADGSLAEGRALLVFALLYIPLFALFWVGHQRAWGGDHLYRGALLDRLVGKTALSALVLPLVVIIAKTFVAALNILTFYSGLSPSRAVRTVLSPAGLWSWQIGYLVTASVILALSVWLVRPIVRRWIADIRDNSLTG